MPTILLKQKNPYFRNLSAAGQQKFVDRVMQFMEHKYFIGREGLVITDEIKVLISAAAVQLTFGLKDFLIAHLHTINVFPRTFYSKMFETSFKGLTTQGGILSLSWSDFKEGYADENDKLNLGLHELAHALNIDLDENGNTDDVFATGFERFKTEALEDFKKLKSGEATFLRTYGGRNMHEFFAVCVEHFFEVPEDFKTELPHLYWILAEMLNQDPSNISGDYVFEQGDTSTSDAAQDQQSYTKREVRLVAAFDAQASDTVFISNTFREFIRKKGIYVAMTTTFIGLFLGIPMLIYFWSTTLISTGTILIMLFVAGALGLLQWKFVKDLLDLEYHQFSMYAFTGFGMCLTNFVFFLNHVILVSTHTQTYEVIGYTNGPNGLEITLAGEDNSENLERNVASYIFDNYDRIPVAKTITVTTDRGLFGFEMINDCKIN